MEIQHGMMRVFRGRVLQIAYLYRSAWLSSKTNGNETTRRPTAVRVSSQQGGYIVGPETLGFNTNVILVMLENCR